MCVFVQVHNIFDDTLGNLLTTFPLLANIDVSGCPIKCIPNNIDTMIPLSVLTAQRLRPSGCTLNI